MQVLEPHKFSRQQSVHMLTQSYSFTRSCAGRE